MESYISVDVEAAGPTTDYSMLSFGACEVGNPDEGFYQELEPINDNIVPSALEVSRFNMDWLRANGTNPKEAMDKFDEWLGWFQKPIMIAFNATFDWQFINYYFHRFLGRNPFGISAIDIKAMYMGYAGATEWKMTAKKNIPKEFLSKRKHTHNALDDAKEQAEIFRNIYDAMMEANFA